MRELTEGAVRWATGYYGDRLDFTTWHYVLCNGWTACGRMVPRAEKLVKREDAPVERTACRQCLRRQVAREAIAASKTAA